LFKILFVDDLGNRLYIVKTIIHKLTSKTILIYYKLYTVSDHYIIYVLFRQYRNANNHRRVVLTEQMNNINNLQFIHTIEYI